MLDGLVLTKFKNKGDTWFLLVGDMVLASIREQVFVYFRNYQIRYTSDMLLEQIENKPTLEEAIACVEHLIKNKEE